MSQTPAALPGPPPQVWVVTTFDADDPYASAEVAGVFDNEDAAREYAAQYVEPVRANVFPMPLLTQAAQLKVTYTLRMTVPLHPRSTFARFARGASDRYWDPHLVGFDTTQEDPAEAGPAQPPVTVTARDLARDQQAVYIEAVGTDKDAVMAGFVEAVEAAKARAAQNGLVL